MATPNYSYEKRQKELAKKRKKEDKLKRKGEGRPDEDSAEDGVQGAQTGDGEPTGVPPADAAS
ncbi:MAG: hypothetical protein JWR68_41 [Polaromonas sp.]|nr:hypothetical protein [Polaromonas sp.]MDB5778709.1 hypothetical protein [Polaromonas sp.]